MTGVQLELFTVESLTTAQAYIEKDGYTGKHTVAFSPSKHRVALYTASEIAAMVPANENFPIFESFGHVRGVEHFARTRFLTDGTGRLFGYDSDGALKIIHPAGRKLRVLTGR